MRRHYILYLFLLFLVTNSQGQYFRPGYIVTLSNDTILGSLDESYEELLNQQVSFREAENLDFKEFFPEEIKSFSFDDGVLYESKAFGDQTLFFKCLIRGPVSAYVLAEDSLAGFYLEKGTHLRLLEENKVSWYDIETRELKTKPLYHYLNEFEAMFGECYQDNPQNKFTEKNIQKLFLSYFGCTGETFEKFPLQLPRVFGISFTTFYVPIFDIASFRNNIQLNWMLPRTRRRFGYMLFIGNDVFIDDGAVSSGIFIAPSLVYRKRWNRFQGVAYIGMSLVLLPDPDSEIPLILPRPLLGVGLEYYLNEQFLLYASTAPGIGVSYFFD